MKVTIEVPEEKIKYCNLCGRPFDREDYGKTMTEQTEGMRTDCDKYFNIVATCGLFCAWLSQPDMVRNLEKHGRYETVYQQRKYNNLVKMRDYIAKRVAEYLLQETKVEKQPSMDMQNTKEKVREKRFFIAKENKVRWIKQFITKNIGWDDGNTHLVVSMENNLNEANRSSDCKIESVNVNDCFETERDTEMEILRRERFETK